MENKGFFSTMFLPLGLLAFALLCAFGASVGGYSEEYALYGGYLITLAVAVWQTYENWKGMKP